MEVFGLIVVADEHGRFYSDNLMSDIDGGQFVSIVTSPSPELGPVWIKRLIGEVNLVAY